MSVPAVIEPDVLAALLSTSFETFTLIEFKLQTPVFLHHIISNSFNSMQNTFQGLGGRSAGRNPEHSNWNACQAYSKSFNEKKSDVLVDCKAGTGIP